MGQLLPGKEIAAKIKEEIKGEVERLKNENNLIPALCAVQIGENPSSAMYVKAQKKNAESLGISYTLHTLNQDIEEEQAVELIQSLNKDENIHGIILQLPVPAHLDAKKIINLVDPRKDVEGMHPEN